jgi:hypothetical protein
MSRRKTGYLIGVISLAFVLSIPFVATGLWLIIDMYLGPTQFRTSAPTLTLDSIVATKITFLFVGIFWYDTHHGRLGFALWNDRI